MSSPAAADAPAQVDEEARRFWAFQSLREPAVPAATGDRDFAPVDHFVSAQLADGGLAIATQADRATLLRRLSYDLVGLPPAPEEIAAFLADDRPDAYERLVDRLLASPHFGERWGRHWLDAAGYSDITGGDNDAGIIKLSDGKWKYRDYVVRAFNQDKPYEQFLAEQLAGDELVDWRAAPAFTPEIQELLAATGFLRASADDTDEKELATPDIINAVLQRTSEVVANNLLGLTVACAKCHDHKYEPISQQDYYRLLANFSPVFNPSAWIPPKQRTLADIPPAQKAEGERHNAEIDKQVAALKARQADIERPHREKLADAKLATLPEPIRADTKAAVQVPANKRTEVQKYLAEKFGSTIAVSQSEVAATLSAEEKSELASAASQIKQLESTRRSWGAIQAAYENGPPPETHLLVRGNYLTPGPVVQPGFPAALCSLSSVSNDTASSSRLKPVGPTSGRRLALALWLTDWRSPAGGLAARVMVNRVWQHLFGRGIVETSDNLGVSGAAPSDSHLLEWLACRFVEDGRRIKPLIRLLVTSATYRQASADPAGTTSPPRADTAPGLPARMPLKRLEAEIVRDAMLAASGQLNPALGGPPIPLETRSDGSVVVQEKALPAPSAKLRRSLYILARRNYHLSMLNVFDQPAMSTNCPRRQQSAVVLQSLALLNDDFVIAQAEGFADRVIRSAGTPTAARIDLAFRVALGRPATASEAAATTEFLEGHRAEQAPLGSSDEEAPRKALTQLCHMLLSSNEFLYAP
jgi:hypothetical protein